jgi:signal peptidase I
MATTEDPLTPPDDFVLPKRESAGSRAGRHIAEWVGLIVAAIVIALVVKAFLIQAFYIPSASMEPTLKVHDRVLVNKLSYRLHDVHRGDIVVFKAPKGEATAQIKDLIKRVIGRPGDKIEGHDGKIFIDGRELKEPYLPEGQRSKDFQPVTVPANSYYVLGDNRLDSKDSTFFGPIKRSEIVGRAFVRIWPLRSVGFL